MTTHRARLSVEAVPRDETEITEEGWPFQTSVLVSAVRCTVRYMLLPFVLPLAGIASGAALAVLLVLDVIAGITIVSTLRRLWRAEDPRRWQYLLMALGMTVLIGFFFFTDVRVMPG